jgi:proteasome lid subunit RPN8/RPN11
MIILPKSILQQMIKNCKEEVPYESCGILAGNNRKVEKIYKMKNIEKSSTIYLMDSKEQLYVMKDIRNSGLKIEGIYHSHVFSSAQPSKKDIEMAFYPDISYIIVSLEKEQYPVVKSFQINREKGNIEEEFINIENG